MERDNELVMGVPTHTLFETGFYFKRIRNPRPARALPDGTD